MVTKYGAKSTRLIGFDFGVSSVNMIKKNKFK